MRIKTINNINIFKALRAELLFVDKVTKTATRFVPHILTKLNSSLSKSHWSMSNAQTNLALTLSH